MNVPLENDQDSPIYASGDCKFNEKLENKTYFLSDEDALLLDKDSDCKLDDEEFMCMDFEKYMNEFDNEAVMNKFKI